MTHFILLLMALVMSQGSFLFYIYSIVAALLVVNSFLSIIVLCGIFAKKTNTWGDGEMFIKDTSSSFKISTFQGTNVQQVIIVNNSELYTWKQLLGQILSVLIKHTHKRNGNYVTKWSRQQHCGGNHFEAYAYQANKL